MSDEKLRELERRWKETGSVGDEARYLLERVRVGDLEQEKLELAAYCGHPGACRAVRRAVMPYGTASDAERWTEGLAKWGRPVLALAAAFAGQHAVDHRPTLPGADELRALHSHAAALARDVSEDKDAIRALLEAVSQLPSDESLSKLVDRVAKAAYEEPCWAARAVGDAMREAAFWTVQQPPTSFADPKLVEAERWTMNVIRERLVEYALGLATEPRTD